MTGETALDRVDVFGAGAGEIVEGVQTAKAAQAADDIFGDGAGVKAVAAVAGDGRQTAGQARLAEFAAQRRCRAVDQHGLAGDRVGTQDALVQNPIVIDPRITRKAVAGIGDGRRQQIGERHAPVVAVEQFPGGDRAGHGHGVRVKRSILSSPGRRTMPDRPPPAPARTR